MVCELLICALKLALAIWRLVNSWIPLSIKLREEQGKQKVSIYSHATLTRFTLWEFCMYISLTDYLNCFKNF